MSWHIVALHTFSLFGQDILNQRIVTLTYDLSWSYKHYKVKPMRSLYNLRWVQQRNCCRSWYISRQKVWPWFMTTRSHSRSNLTVPVESPWLLYMLPGVQPRIYHRFRDISSQRFWRWPLTLRVIQGQIWWMVLNLAQACSRRLSAILQNFSLIVQMCVTVLLIFFTFWPWGNPWAKVHQKGK